MNKTFKEIIKTNKVKAVESPCGHWVHLAVFDSIYWRTPCHLFLDTVSLKNMVEISCPRCLAYSQKALMNKTFEERDEN